MKLKKTTAAILVAGLTVAGSSLAFANETVFKTDEVKDEIAAEVTTAADIKPVVMDPSKVLEDDTSTENDATNEETLEEDTIKDDSTEEASVDNKETDVAKETDKKDEDNKNEASKSEFPEIPEGYTAGNLVALKQAYENAGNENAKQAILKNAERAIEKFNAKHGSKDQAEKSEVKVNVELIGIQKAGESIIEPVKKETVIQTEETTVKTENKVSTKQQQKAEEKALKEKHKAEKKALKAEHKAEKKNGKDKE